MATAMNRSPCVKCDKQKAIMKCEGCLQTFRYNHMMDHRQELSKKLDDVEVIRDTIRQTLTEQTTEPRKHALIQQIDHWERDSIDKIRQTAEKARQLLLKHTAGHFTKTEAQLNQLTDLLQQSRPNNDFVETDLNHWKDELTRIAEQLANPWNVKIRKDSESLVTKIDIDIVGKYIDSIQIKKKYVSHQR
jgi:chromosome segregation ATPase